MSARKELFNNVICADNSFRLGQRKVFILFLAVQPECFRLIGFSVCIVVGLRGEKERGKERSGVGFACYLLLKEMCARFSHSLLIHLCAQPREKLARSRSCFIIKE